MRIPFLFPLHLAYLTLTLLDDDAQFIYAYAHEQRPPVSLQSWHYLSNSSLHNHKIALARRAEEVKLGDELAICTPQDACKPCPKEELHEPYCQPFGNRRLLHCMPSSNSNPHNSDTLADDTTKGSNDGGGSSGSRPPPEFSKPPATLRPAYESCGRLVPKERADFFEFVLCNVIFAALALAGVMVRSERMRVARARRLAARIGVGLVRRASSGTWTRTLGGLAVSSPSGGAGPSMLDSVGPESDGLLMRHDDSG